MVPIPRTLVSTNDGAVCYKRAKRLARPESQARGNFFGSFFAATTKSAIVPNTPSNTPANKSLQPCALTASFHYAPSSNARSAIPLKATLTRQSTNLDSQSNRCLYYTGMPVITPSNTIASPTKPCD